MLGPRTIYFGSRHYTLVRSGGPPAPRLGEPMAETPARHTLMMMMRDEHAARQLRMLYAELSHDPVTTHDTNDTILRWYHGQLRAGIGGLRLLVRASFTPADHPKETLADSHDAQEARRIDALLRTLGDKDLHHRGSGYRIARVEANHDIAQRASLEVLGENQAKRVLDELAQDTGRSAAQYEALRELAAWYDKLRSHPTLQLLVLRRNRMYRSEVEQPSVTPSQLRKQREVHWVEILLEDSQGKALPGVACEITLPDGSKVTKISDDLGCIRIDDAGAGQCSVSLPKFDAKVWSAA